MVLSVFLEIAVNDCDAQAVGVWPEEKVIEDAEGPGDLDKLGLGVREDN